MIRATLAALALFTLGACDSGGGSVAPAGVAECPACECKCECAPSESAVVAADPSAGAADGAVAADDGPALDDGGGGTTPVKDVGVAASPLAPPVVPVAGNVGDLVASANRKMMHDDGKGCLADLDAVAALDPKMNERLAISRGQCEMLIGKCQEGKKRIARWYELESALTPGRAEIQAEQLGAMRCRGGNSTDRDQLLRAFFELSDGAYMNKRSSKWCAERVSIIRRLLPKVPPRDVDDTQISGGGQALFHTAAACHARAENCKAAFSIYRDLFPKTGLAAIKDAAQREKIVRDSFDSSIERCKGTP